MTDLRATFLATGRVAVDLVTRPEVAAGWDGPSALERLSVRGLAGHLARAVGQVEAYLDQDEPPVDGLVDPAHYYLAALGAGTVVDLDSDLHTSVRQRGEDTAAAGHGALVADMEALVGRLAGRLGTEPHTRRVAVLHGLALTLDDYLVTRIVELVVHSDDLAVSAGVPTPALPAEATAVAISALLSLARLRHGDLVVLQALARRERAPVGVLNAF